MFSLRGALPLLLVLIAHYIPLILAQTVRFHNDCLRPDSQWPEKKSLGDVKSILYSAIDMAKTGLQMMEEAERLPTTDQNRIRVGYITQLLLACQPGDDLFAKAKESFRKVASISTEEGDFKTTMYCTEDHVPGRNFPFWTPTCTPDGKVNAYAARGDTIVMCPSAWETNARGRVSTVLNSFMRTNNWKKWGDDSHMVWHFDHFVSTGATLLHELFHSTSFTNFPPGFGITDVSFDMGGESVVSYGFKKCRILAQRDLAAQAARKGKHPSSFWVSVFGQDPFGRETAPGSCIINADSLMLTAIQFYMIDNDLVSNGFPQNFRDGGFNVPPAHGGCEDPGGLEEDDYFKR